MIKISLVITIYLICSYTNYVVVVSGEVHDNPKSSQLTIVG